MRTRPGLVSFEGFVAVRQVIEKGMSAVIHFQGVGFQELIYRGTGIQIRLVSAASQQVQAAGSAWSTAFPGTILTGVELSIVQVHGETQSATIRILGVLTNHHERASRLPIFVCRALFWLRLRNPKEQRNFSQLLNRGAIHFDLK